MYSRSNLIGVACLVYATLFFSACIYRRAPIFESLVVSVDRHSTAYGWHNIVFRQELESFLQRKGIVLDRGATQLHVVITDVSVTNDLVGMSRLSYGFTISVSIDALLYVQKKMVWHTSITKRTTGIKPEASSAMGYFIRHYTTETFRSCIRTLYSKLCIYNGSLHE